MTRDQKIVLAGALSGMASMLAGTFLIYCALRPQVELVSAGDRLAYAAKWAAIAALPLFAMVAAVGNRRFTSEAIDPTRGVEDKAMIIDGRVADNTLQQFVLFLAGSLGLAASLPPERMQLIAAAAIVFVIARICFWIGYRIHPLYRAFGFSSTAYLNLGLLVGSAWLALT